MATPTPVSDAGPGLVVTLLAAGALSVVGLVAGLVAGVVTIRVGRAYGVPDDTPARGVVARWTGDSPEAVPSSQATAVAMGTYALLGAVYLAAPAAAVALGLPLPAPSALSQGLLAVVLYTAGFVGATWVCAAAALAALAPAPRPDHGTLLALGGRLAVFGLLMAVPWLVVG